MADIDGISSTSSSSPLFFTAWAFSRAMRTGSRLLVSTRLKAMAFSASAQVIPVAASRMASSASPPGLGVLADSQMPSKTCSSSGLPGRAKSRTTNSRSSSGGRIWRQPTTIKVRPCVLARANSSFSARSSTGFASSRKRWKSRSSTMQFSPNPEMAAIASIGSLAGRTDPSAVLTSPSVTDQA